jgi:hypothetical protein
MTTLTVCIATMRRFAYLQHSLPLYLAMPCIAKVIVCDETGEDVRAIKTKPWSADPKLELHVNERRLGALGNKDKCVSLAQGWVALIDSDNFAPYETYFKPWVDYMLRWSYEQIRHVIFMPAKSSTPEGAPVERHIDFSKFEQLDMTNVGTAVQRFQSAFALLNNGNFIVHADVYNVPFTNPKLAQIAKEHAMTPWDAALKMLQLLKRGNVLGVMPFMSYEHAVHGDSLFAKDGETKDSRLCFGKLYSFCLEGEKEAAQQGRYKQTRLPPFPAKREDG